MQDLAFVPIQIVLVTIILNRFLSIIETRRRVKKINVIISSFFVEAGILIMTMMSEFNRNGYDLCRLLKISQINKKNKLKVKKSVREFKFDIYADSEKLVELSSVLSKYKAFMINMLENPDLLEHESFTDMLWATFHVADELQTRDLKTLTKIDIDHLTADIYRAYAAMVIEWINYMVYLYDEYPFLYDLALRKNPLLGKEDRE